MEKAPGAQCWKGNHVTSFLREFYMSSPRPWGQIGILMLWTVFVIVTNEVLCGDGQCKLTLPTSVVGPITVILTFLIVFRTNQAYSRYWEARSQWGGVATDCCALADLVASMVKDDRIARRLFFHIMAFPYSCKQHLRNKPLVYEELSHVLDANEVDFIDKQKWSPQAIATLLSNDLFGGGIPGTGFVLVGNKLAGMLESFMCMVKIKVDGSSPAIFRILLHTYTIIYLFLLPLFSYQDQGRWILLTQILTSYLMLSLQIASSELADPFGFDKVDLEMEKFCQVIDELVQQSMRCRARKGDDVNAFLLRGVDKVDKAPVALQSARSQKDIVYAREVDCHI
ncbi:unnamed protein product [Discosporangium mesarthrocarpum]